MFQMRVQFILCKYILPSFAHLSLSGVQMELWTTPLHPYFDTDEPLKTMLKYLKSSNFINHKHGILSVWKYMYL